MRTPQRRRHALISDRPFKTLRFTAFIVAALGTVLWGE
jgi:hypothetical protein